jgi:hypothetical protein
MQLTALCAAVDVERSAPEMIATDAILRVKRLATALKVAGIMFLGYHCVTADVRFNPVWVAVYVGVTFLLANACVGVEFLVNRMRSQTSESLDGLTPEERQCVRKMDAQGHRIWRNPRLFLLIAGEDGFFFLPLLYLGINPATAIAAAALFALMHYRDKPNFALAGTFLITAANVLIVLPHGILPMVFGHCILDATAFGMVPVLRKWVGTDQRKKGNAQPATAPHSEPGARSPQG